MTSRMALGFFFVFLLSVSVSGQQPAASPATQSESQPASESLIDTKLQSAILNEERRVIIHLPRNYAQDVSMKYPVMYVLDGTSQDQHTSDKLTVLSDAGLAPRAIVVGIPNTRGNRDRDQTPPFMRRDVNDPDSAFGGGDKFLAFIEKELIPHVETQYRASGHRTLTGNSRGGLLVLYSLLERPALFHARFCYSTPVWRFDNMMVHRTVEFLRTSSGPPSFLYLSVGDKETAQMVGGFNALVAALKKTPKKKLKWVATSTPYAIHQDNALISTSRGLSEWAKYLQTK